MTRVAVERIAHWSERPTTVYLDIGESLPDTWLGQFVTALRAGGFRVRATRKQEVEVFPDLSEASDD